MDVSQWAIDLKLAPANRNRLEALVRSGNTPQKLVPRARIALLSDGMLLNGAIAREVGVALPTVHRWQRRVQEQGVDGLVRDKTRPSRIPPLAPDVVERVVEMTLQEPPGEATHWSSRTMAAASGVSATSVRRGWRPEGQRRKRGIDGEALGRSRGGFSTKIRIRAEGLGKPVTFTLTGGEVHDSKAFATLMGTGWIRRLGCGRPRLKPDRLAADKAYSSGVIRSALRRRSITPVIPTKSNERPNAAFDRDAYRERNRVERLINRLKQFRRIATRYEKRAVNYLAMITIAAILLWL